MKATSARRLGSSRIVFVKLEVPRELHRRVKVRAAEEEVKLGDFFVAAAAERLQQTKAQR